MIDILSEIPDFRKAKGKRHPLPAILALACAAIMCGYKGYKAFSEWGRNYGEEFMEALRFTHEKGPCAATFSIIFRHFNVRLLERKIGVGILALARLSWSAHHSHKTPGLPHYIFLDSKNLIFRMPFTSIYSRILIMESYPGEL